MSPAAVDPALGYARLAWPTDPSMTTYTPNFLYIPAPLFENIKFKGYEKLADFMHKLSNSSPSQLTRRVIRRHYR